MATQVIQAGDASNIGTTRHRWRRAAGDPLLLATFRAMGVVILLAIALCSLLAMASLGSAGTTPLGGPAPGLGL